MYSSYASIWLLATGVTITQTLPANTTFEPGGSTPGWVDQSGGTYTFDIGNLDVGQTGSILFAVKVNSSLPPGYNQLLAPAAGHPVLTIDGFTETDPRDSSGRRGWQRAFQGSAIACAVLPVARRAISSTTHDAVIQRRHAGRTPRVCWLP